MVQYYKEQAELPEKLNLSERLEEAEECLIKLEKDILPIYKKSGEKGYNPESIFCAIKTIKPYVMPGIQEDKESYIYKMGSYIKAIKNERYLDKLHSLSRQRKELKKKHAEEVENLEQEKKKLEEDNKNRKPFWGNDARKLAAQQKLDDIIISKLLTKQTNLLTTHAEKELELELKLTSQEDIILAKLKEFIDFESQFNNNLPVLIPEKYMYIPYRIKEYETQRDIQQKWINKLRDKISPLCKVIVELKKIIKKQSDEYPSSNICDILVKKN